MHYETEAKENSMTMKETVNKHLGIQKKEDSRRFEEIDELLEIIEKRERYWTSGNLSS